uniref:Ras-GEF domain-containing protein n=1 Tax=Toxocara canis TaxID=6265 RepID=A0A183UQ92_TOXCA
LSINISRIFRKVTDKEELLLEHIKSATAVAHSLAVRDAIKRTRNKYLIVDFTDTPVSWRSLCSATDFMRTGQLRFRFSELADMLQALFVAALLRMPEMLRLVESYLRHMSLSPKNALQCAEIAFCNERHPLVSSETRDFIADVLADQFAECISSFNPLSVQKVESLSVNTLVALLDHNSRRKLSSEESARMSLMRCQSVVLWLRANPAYIMDAERLFRTVRFEQMNDSERHSAVAWLRKLGYAIYAAAENFLIEAEFQGLKIQQQSRKTNI